MWVVLRILLPSSLALISNSPKKDTDMLVKNPGRLSLETLEKQPVHAVTENRILTALKVKGRVHSALLEHRERQHYFIETDTGHYLFVKCVAAEQYSSRQQAEAISKWLYEQGCCTPLLMDIVDFNAGGKKCQLWVYLYVQGKFCLPNENDIALVGESIAKLHLCLKRNPKIIHWHENTIQKYHQLSRIRKQLLSGVIENSHITKKARQLFEEFDLAYFLKQGATPLHGDLSPENFMITLDKNVCFFNFNQTSSHFERPVTELGYVIERLILGKVENQHQALTLGKTLLDNYYHAGGQYDHDESDKHCLQFLRLRELCHLLLFEETDNPPSPQAWDNALHLLDIAEQRKELFCRILFD